MVITNSVTARKTPVTFSSAAIYSIFQLADSYGESIFVKVSSTRSVFFRPFMPKQGVNISEEALIYPLPIEMSSHEKRLLGENPPFISRKARSKSRRAIKLSTSISVARISSQKT